MTHINCTFRFAQRRRRSVGRAGRQFQIGIPVAALSGFSSASASDSKVFLLEGAGMVVHLANAPSTAPETTAPVTDFQSEEAVRAEAEAIMPKGAALQALFSNSPPPAEWWDEDSVF